MAEDGEHVDAEPRDAAAEAFEQLRGEVAQLRGLVEEMAERLGERVPDYTPTLAAMAQTLTQMERHPALQHTPERFRAENRENLKVFQHICRFRRRRTSHFINCRIYCMEYCTN